MFPMQTSVKFTDQTQRIKYENNHCIPKLNTFNFQSKMYTR